MIKTIVIISVLIMGLGSGGCAKDGLEYDDAPSGKGIVSKPTHTPEEIIEEEKLTTTPTDILTETPSITPRIVPITLTPFNTPSQDLALTGTPQPNINAQTECGLSHLQIGMSAFSQMPLRIFNKGRYRNSPTNPVDIITILPKGTLVKIIGPSGDGLYNCTLKSLMWQISYEGMLPGQGSFAFEFYKYVNEKDDPTWLEGYYLSPYPPP